MKIDDRTRNAFYIHNEKQQIFQGKEERDIWVDIIRIIACFLVIMVHIRIPLRGPGGNIRKAVILINCILTPAVGIFFMITGFFMYRSDMSIKKTAFRFLKHIMMPSVCIAFTSIVLREWLFDRTDVFGAIYNSDFMESVDQVVRGVLSLNVSYWGDTCGHLWYVMEYAQLILMFPFIAILIRYANDKILVYVAGFTLIRAVVMDINQFFPFPFEIFVTSFFPVSQSYCIIGYLLYKNKTRLARPKVTIVMAGMYGVILCLMLILEINYVLNKKIMDFSGMYYSTLHSGIGQLMTFILVTFFLSLSWVGEKINHRGKQIISYIGNMTFYIYLIHFMIIMKLRSSGFEMKFTAKISTSVDAMCYYFFYGLYILWISLIFAIFIKNIVKQVDKIVKKYKTN